MLFSTIEYELFRDFLAPASGFQTAQLRLIQRALGKVAAPRMPVFPGDAFGQALHGLPRGHVALGDPLVLRWRARPCFPARACPGPGRRRAWTTGARRPRPPRRPRRWALRAAAVRPSTLRRWSAPSRASAPRSATRPNADEIAAHVPGDLERGRSRRERAPRRLDDARRGATALHARLRTDAASPSSSTGSPRPMPRSTRPTPKASSRSTVKPSAATSRARAARAEAGCRTSSRASASSSPSSLRSSPTRTSGRPATDEDSDRW